MRFPNFTDLDEEQVKIYGHAPADGAILVVGPPGTGKTVMAFHRAQKLAALGQSPIVIMFNKVLRKYSGSRKGVAEDVPVMTMHQWVHRWWTNARMGRAPKDRNDSWSYDWQEILSKVECLDAEDARLQSLNWGHLIIDEGQDFSETMYFALGRIMRHLGKHGYAARLTVFADDNQRLEVERNSTVENIARNLGLSLKRDRIFFLEKNYRNTKEIARFSRYFQVGRTRGAAGLPTASGELPTVGLFEDECDLFDFICRKARLSPGKQFGVIVHGSIGDVRSAYNKLHSRCKPPLTVQRYFSTKGQNLDETLNFDATNVVTIVNEKSAKGLEFDMVFYIGLQKADIDSSGALNERMVAYVVSSRAREELMILFSGVGQELRVPDGHKIMPRNNLGLCRYDGFGRLSESAAEILKGIDWREPEAGAPFWREVV